MKAGILAATLMLSGCAFSLGYVNPQTGKTHDQLQLDTLVCKDDAAQSIRHAGRVAGDVALGATIVGTPLAVHLDRSKQREVFKTCMNAKGYEVVKDY